MLDQIAHHLADRSQALKQIEHQADRGLCLLIRVKHNLARRAAQISHRHCLAEFTAPRLGFAPLQHAGFEDVQFCLRHRSFEPQQQTIIVVGRIIYPIGIGDQRIEKSTDFQ
jgi:hypothetical protein